MPDQRLICGETGAQRRLGYVIDIGRGDGVVAVALEVGEDHMNRQDLLHGGLTALLLDTAMGVAASLSAGDDAAQRFSTVSMTVNYLAPGRRGAVEAVGRCIGGGHRTVFAEATLRQVTDDALIATASGVYRQAKERA